VTEVHAKPTASVSLDMDNLWSYLKVHGNPEWEGRPSYLPALQPRLLEVFAAHGLRATVFVVGADVVRDDGAEVVRAVAAAGHEVGNHSFEHEPWLHRYERGRLEDDLARTEDAVVVAGAPRPTGFRGPGYSLSADLVDLLADRGYAYDASVLATWIGPLARAYYLRSARLSDDEGTERDLLFGTFRDALRPVHAFRWAPQGLLEVPVTTMPLVRLPIHLSYVLFLHGCSPRLARAYFRAALALCRRRGVEPSLLLHPLDLLDGRDAPALEFFPGMHLRASVKLDVLSWALDLLCDRFDVVGVGEHARRLADAGVRRRQAVDGLAGAGRTP
jgi:peptidoglycan/xylan/chitin deacetylase (PgdA/CDA1 family)